MRASPLRGLASLATACAGLLAAGVLGGCQMLFPTPIDQDADTRPSGAVRALGEGFVPGERMKSEVSLDGVVAGVGELTTGARCLADGRPVVPVTSKGRSAGLVRMFQDASSDVRTLVDADTNAPVEAAWEVQLGKRRQAIDQLFGESSYRFLQTRELPDKPPKISVGDVALPIDGTPHDAHTSLGYLRRWQPEPGTRGHLYAVYGRNVWRADLTFRGAETITTADGPRRASRIDGLATKLLGRNLRPSSITPRRPFTMWIGDDADRVPLRMLIETQLAKVTIDVVEYARDPAVAQAPLAPCEPRVDHRAIAEGIAKKKKKKAEPLRNPDGEPETEDEREEREDREALEKLLRR